MSYNMHNENYLVSVIIPTLADTSRSASLKRCIESVRSSSAHSIQIIAVVNGVRFDGETCDWLRSQPDINVVFDPLPSAPNAVCRGRSLVHTPYFSTIDDDDEYLPQSTDRKLSALSTNTSVDLVVANGYLATAGVDEVFYERLHTAKVEPLIAMFEQNWLNSGNALFRTESFPLDFFEDYHPFAEWTWLAFKAASAEKKIEVVNEPCFRNNVTLGSLSSSEAYYESYFSLFQRMLETVPARNIRQLINRRMANAWHDKSVRSLASGNYLDAIKSHCRCLLLPSGERYISYSRRLIPGWPAS